MPEPAKDRLIHAGMIHVDRDARLALRNNGITVEEVIRQHLASHERGEWAEFSNTCHALFDKWHSYVALPDGTALRVETTDKPDWETWITLHTPDPHSDS